ncbi:FAD-dependent oxidoreductase [Cohnella sp. JJ-181]|uniref:FAD-dependent oxidoreductase n=1 Tax=Cohnella rhizoplanae TaxID=2974897 RepID=UPI0022FF9EA4|nr:FAD-dependent oxidoreductase [Cohnella sp. JJ-181]CAI6085506.1 hypothetical protein COHCIP112018_04694 [Cohnella sp. JJ-181]
MRQEQVNTDITVIGGGLAGVNAAIAAARLGSTVALVQNRPMLGGNSSSEVRVWVCGATAHGTNRYARETGIMGEMFLENQFRNPDGNPYYWDLVVLEAVRAEPNIQLFLNTDVHEVEADGPAEERVIRSVTGWMMGSERRIRFESKAFIDCTGDGLVGYLAGARYRIGREAASEYQEAWAPEEADDITLGSTLLFYTKDAGHPVKYVPPSFARDIAQTTIPLKRVISTGDNGCRYWWIEWGGEMDIVDRNENIRDELQAAIYGIWDYIKNSGKFDAERLTLEWVGSLPGKREYRRFIGDYMLNQNDILGQTTFADQVGFGGWSIDLHPPQGMYSSEKGSKHYFADGLYSIPFRSLYSANVKNMLMAGRNISATHVAFGTTRVMATCAIMGEAAGTGASLCAAKGVTPRELHRSHLEELQQTMLRQDASILGIANEDDRDLARRAAIAASSTRTVISVESPAIPVPLARDVAVLFPVEPELAGVGWLADVARDAELTVELWSTGRPENYVPQARVATASVKAEAGERQWINFDIAWRPETAQNAFLILKANDAVTVYQADKPCSGVLAFYKGGTPIVDPKLGDRQPPQPVSQWSMDGKARQPLCFRVASATDAYAAVKLTDGYRRPYGGPHTWVSEPMAAGREEWAELVWDTPVAVASVQVVFNDDVNEDLVNLHHHRTPFEVVPELVKDYRLEAKRGGEWFILARVADNRKRTRTHTFAKQVQVEALRLVIEATNGSESAEVVEIRVYGGA